MAKSVIDVSYAQGVIDWDKVDSQIDGAILRVGYGSDQAGQDDVQYARNLDAVKRLGIPYGVYLYSYANSDEKIRSEIQHMLRLIKGEKPTLGVFLDLEENKNGTWATRAAVEWCKAINAAGYRAGIYTGAYYYLQHMQGCHDLVKGLWWIAGYGTNSGRPELQYKPKPGFEYDAWQYTSNRHYAGINNSVDTSEWYADFTDKTIAYRAHCQTYGWMTAVKDGEVAGTVGLAKRLEAIKVTPPEGWELNATAHIQSIGDKEYKGIRKGPSSGTGSSPTDPIIGSVGEGKRLEAIKFDVVKKTSGTLKYRVHMQGTGWGPWTLAGGWAGTKGQARRLEAIQIKIE